MKKLWTLLMLGTLLSPLLMTSQSAQAALSPTISREQTIQQKSAPDKSADGDKKKGPRKPRPTPGPQDEGDGD